MTTFHEQAVIPGELEKVWKIVTTVADYPAWRSDLSKAEVLDGARFAEYTKEGYVTTFATTLLQPMERWEFDLENGNMTGHWVGVFTAKGAETQLDITQSIRLKKFYMRPFVGPYMRKQQARFLSELRQAVLCEEGG